MSHLLHVEKLGLPKTGMKPILVMLHGWGTSLDSLKPLGELLSHAYTILLIDLPGFGQSPVPGAVWDSFEYADHLLGYLKENRIEKFSLIGHSFGGKIAMSLASRYPQFVDKLVIMAASGLRRQRSFKQKCRFYAVKWLGKTLKKIDAFLQTNLFSHHFSPRFGSIDYKLAGQMRPILIKSVNEDLSPYIVKIKAPTLILWGSNDTETPPEMAFRLKKMIVNSQLVMFPGKDHWLHQDVSCHVCAYHILPFLSQVEAPSHG